METIHMAAVTMVDLAGKQGFLFDPFSSQVTPLTRYQLPATAARVYNVSESPLYVYERNTPTMLNH